MSITGNPNEEEVEKSSWIGFSSLDNYEILSHFSNQQFGCQDYLRVNGKPGPQTNSTNWSHWKGNEIVYSLGNHVSKTLDN